MKILKSLCEEKKTKLYISEKDQTHGQMKNFIPKY
jgi:hypothetical protein